MACSSTSSIQKSFKYDVFLSFRGEDTRANFVDHLYHALHHKSIHTYKDDVRIKKGKRISDELIGSIKDSKFYIIVFSKNYASSSWCLDELVKIMECHSTIEHTAYPVFYDVEPSEVRKQSGAVAEAFAKHENEESAGKWRQALKDAADLAGWELKNTANGHEAEFIQKIVEELSLELRSISFNVDEKLVGMETRVNDVLSALGTDFDDVRMVGIKGMGGGGKTTLARAVFDQISFQFEGISFVENVREVSSASLFGLKSLQNQVLSDVLKDKDIKVSSVYDGKHQMKRRMHDKKVLVVLDDVDHIDQLDALAGEPDWFKPGSRIIITTRDAQVLVAHRVKFIRDVTLLSDGEAICLFSRYAFGRDIPIQGYEELSRQVVRYAAGLPLTMRVLGSFLCGKIELEWVDALERLKTIPLAETLKKLELSYIGLEEDYKEIFLDVACIMKGWRKDKAVKVLESCGFHARNGLRVLQQKSLITINGNSNYEWVDMHDHIVEMGRNIVRRLHPNKPHKHSRLWINEEIEDILANELGTKATRCIRSTMTFNLDIAIKGLGKMKKLRSLPKTFQANNLVALEMPYSKIVQLWEGGERKVLNKLRFLDLSYSKLSTFDLGLTPNLETLTLRQCSDLVELHVAIGCLKLTCVDLEGSRLRTVDLGLAPNLETVILSECHNLVELHMPDRCLNLRSLLLSNSKLSTLNIGLTPNLMSLDLKNCYYLGDFHMAGECLKLTKLDISHSKLRTLNLGLTPNLEKLDLDNCYCLEELYMADECGKLAYLTISHSKLRTLNLGLTPNLEKLDLDNCYCLEELYMADECGKLAYLTISHSKLRTLNLGLTPNLENLDLDNCYCLEELHMADECGKLAYLKISDSKLRTLNLGMTPNLKKLDLHHCYCLEELYMVDECEKLAYLRISDLKLRTLNLGLTPNLENLDLDNCYCLEELHVADECGKLTYLKITHSKLRTLNFGLTPNLKTLHLKECSNLVELHTTIGCLKKLAHLDISGCLGFNSFLFNLKDYTSCSVDESLEVGPLAELHIIVNSLENCPLHPDNSLPKFQFNCFYEEDRPSVTGNLEMLISLGMCACTNLETFSGILFGLRSLRLLKLEGNILEVLKNFDQSMKVDELILLSPTIKHLPDSIWMLKHLKSLELNLCVWLEKLPEDLGQLESLEKLNLSYTKIKHLPDSIYMLKHLKSLELRFCCFFENLPEDLGRLECLEDLTLSSTMISHLPDSICMLKHLKSLELISCSLLEKLPEDLGRLECLEKLSLEKCEFLQDIPNSIVKMKSLKCFHIPYCIRVEKLPEELGSLECLKEIDIEGTSISHLPQSIFLLKDLHITGSRGIAQRPGKANSERTIVTVNFMGHLQLNIYWLETIEMENLLINAHVSPCIQLKPGKKVEERYDEKLMEHTLGELDDAR
ncbi:unnamed protein product [Lactuca saligna]|uniref:TIR domain-containing protein n=1 Tax=Lactuca saligna TaxID=75948 RepID=A0AA36E3Z1_LACSI|nr:unnamed protein product [Lactuca saligna]